MGPGDPAIRLGATHGLLLASDGSLWTWGEDYHGWPVLGLGNIRKQLSLRRIGLETNWSSIAVSHEHNLAIKSDGTLWGWGENIYGQLGLGTGVKSQSTPAPLPFGNDWKQAAAGGVHSVALRKDGTLWAWGHNWAGQLGIGSTNRIVREAVQVGAETNWVRVWAGLLETVALKSDGSLWFWGDNPNPAVPQTGPGAQNISLPARVSSDTNWVDVGFGLNTILAIKSDGTLWAWGRQAHAFTCARDQTLDARPLQVGTSSDWQSISPSGWLYQVLMKKDGTLWGMQASMGSVPKPLIVARIGLNKDLVAFAGSGGHPLGVFLTRDGEVWTSGKVLGENTPEHKSLKFLAGLAERVHWYVTWGESQPVIRDELWQLPISDSADK